ncbi:PPOX class F420-dependent oxidoreductase [Jatrophihabitans telluris]|uniref:PPOX class F420-dependent oxidoreductase n=1 Tax=Jatrophihabitans telluris TaxID=2038343 RepID=A0ABY4R1R1_9ACTN|nr:PPOX class F420-dependent oxidoreductase [Jatrophihabitans telluris]UQX89086.1 PPOX class F420-dependent oxidoreductase [Jatrophihabitans telluris]
MTTFSPTQHQAGLLELVAGSHQGVLATLKSDGRPQLSNISYAYQADRQLVRVSLTADRAKTANARRDPRVSLHVSSADFWKWATLDGRAELSAVAADPHDETVEELIELYRRLAGEHPDWAEYRAAMVRDRRLVLRLSVEHVYGQI